MPNVSLLLGLALHILAGPPALAELGYTLHPVPLVDRTRIEVTLTFKAKPGEQIQVELPRDYYGSPPLHQFVEGFEGAQGTRVEPGKEANARNVIADATGVVNLKYALSYDPAKLENATFSPNVSANHFHLAGCQWLLRIGDLDESRAHRIQVVQPPAGWKFYSSLGANASKLSTRSSYNDLITATIGGTGRGFYEVKIRGKKVTVSIPSPLQIPDEKVVDAVRKIIDLQRRWFADDSDDYFHVAVNPKGDNIAGTCIRKHFVCFLKHDITPNQLNVLLAHEMFHNWMGNQIVVGIPKGEFSLRHQWFSEGVNEYFARKLLLEAGLISKDTFATLFNADILNLRDNANRNVPLEGLAKVAAEGRFDTSYTKLAYYRGALIALKWDSVLRAAGKPESSGFLRELFKMSNHGEDLIPEAKLFELGAKQGISVKEDFDRYILRGESILPGSEWLGPEFEGRSQDIPSYVVGFDLPGSRAAGVIKGCQEGSRAYEAGLRDGMKFVSAANSNRFGNSWDKAKPLRIVVQDEGKERAIEYFPHGPAQPTMQFVPKK